ncbi:MAG TPA: HAD family phosphatase [Bryobacteraceae bacterium]|jgi:putative hydrolase of the HAD superfamily
MIKTLFTDVGGVLLTNGWGSSSRKLAAEKFGLDFKDIEARHNLTFDTFEVGKITLDEYLQRTVFHSSRTFSMAEFREFMYQQSQPYPEMLELVRAVKASGRHVVVLSNEGRELTEYRIKTFKMAEFADFFVSSCFVHFRKPDRDIFQMAIDLAQADPAESIYLDDRPMFVEVAASLGLQAIRHTDYASTKAAFANLGVVV